MTGERLRNPLRRGRPDRAGFDRNGPDRDGSDRDEEGFGRGGPDRERGAVSIWAAAGLALLFALTVGVVGFGAAADTRHRAGAAADLAALAAAGHAVAGERSACARARWVADRMRVELRSCRLDGWDALVEVSAVPPGVLAGFGPAEARARAGPADRVPHARRTVVPTR